MTSYDDYWKRWTTKGPGEWRQPYHGKPDPEFEMLCQDAERLGLYVDLAIGSGKAQGLAGREFRQLVALKVRKTRRTMPLITVLRQPNESMRAWAKRTRTSLAAA